MLRRTLKRGIAAACLQAAIGDEEIKAKLVSVADSVDQIAFGTFFTYDSKHQQCGCPATLAGYFDADENVWIREIRGYFDDDLGRVAPTMPDALAVRTFPAYFDGWVRSMWESGEIGEEEIVTYCHTGGYPGSGYIKVAD